MPSEANLVRATLLLASAPGHATGDTGQGLEMNLALTPQAQIDRAAWLADPRPWRTRVFAAGAADRFYELIEDEACWKLRAENSDDEPLWRLDIKTVRPGDLVVSLHADGTERVWRIVGVAACE